MRLSDEDWKRLWNIVFTEQRTRGAIKYLSLTIREHKHPEDTVLYGDQLALGGGYSHMVIDFKNGEKFIYDGAISEEPVEGGYYPFTPMEKE